MNILTASNFKNFGREQALPHKGNSNNFESHLPIVYNKLIEVLNQDEKLKTERSNALNKEINNLTTSQKYTYAQIENKKNEIINCEKEIHEINQGKSNNNDAFFSFAIACFITILLTIYLWLFYAASGFAAISGIKVIGAQSGFSAIFSVWEENLSTGNGVAISISLLFPTIFLGMGYLIHDFFEKKKFGNLIFILIFTFLLDILIGFIITKNLFLYKHTNVISNNNETWNWYNIFYDETFYMVLASGFVCYIMWGFLLNTTFKKYKESQPNSLIALITSRVHNLNLELGELESQNQNLLNDINQKNKILDAINKGINFTPEEFNSVVNEFTTGWLETVSFIHANDDLLKNNETIKINKIANEWSKNKLTEIGY